VDWPGTGISESCIPSSPASKYTTDAPAVTSSLITLLRRFLLALSFIKNVNTMITTTIEQTMAKYVGAVGAIVGVPVGDVVGATVGDTVGDIVGATVGDTVGTIVGETVGDVVGTLEQTVF